MFLGSVSSLVCSVCDPSALLYELKVPRWGLPDGSAAAHQSAVRPLGHAGSALDGEARLRESQVLRSSRER